MPPNRFIEIIQKIQTGEMETTPPFVCPECGGEAHMQATLSRSGSRAGLLSISLYCGKCGNGLEIDGVEPWPNWRKIELPPGERIDPKLAKRRLMELLRERKDKLAKD